MNREARKFREPNWQKANSKWQQAKGKSRVKVKVKVKVAGKSSDGHPTTSLMNLASPPPMIFFWRVASTIIGVPTSNGHSTKISL